MNERPPLRSAGRLRRAVTVALLALIGTIGLAGLLPGTALAENSLVSSDPADGSTLAVSPESISFTFSEPLGEVNTITLTCTDLYTVGPREVSADRLTMTAEVIDALPKGACVASFVVSDEEGSPNGQGNITFTIENDPATVETTTAPEETTGDSVPTGEVSTTAATSTGDVADLSDVDSGQGPLWLGRLLSVFGIAVLLGSLVLIAAAWPEGVEYLVTIRFIRAIWIVALIGTLLYVAAATAAVTGSGLGSGFNPANWVDLFDAGLPGIAAVARFVLVVACAWVAFRPDRVIDPVTQMAALGIPALAVATVGFSRTNMDLAIVGVPLSIIHALAMSVWLGGVVLLARVVLAGPGEEDLVHAVRGFTRLSNLAIGATIVTGIVQMILLDGGDLFGTSHGRVLLLKTVAVAGMIFVAVSARQFVNQRLARANEMTVPMADRLRRAFGVEAAAGIIVLAMSAWLLTLAPSNVSAGPDIDYAITLEVDAPEAELALTVQLTRDRVGLSGMSVDVDEPDEGLSGLEVVFTAPANDTIGTITQPVPLTGSGVAVLLEGDQGLPLTVAGDWTMTVNAVTPTGIFTSSPQGFTILNADGTEAVTELTVPPAVNVTIPPLTSEP
ncbi:MAG TPA: CopD family protein [Ilumatobacteraceae bacterium]|nr:CopD family protein [Ilumatobacteraceae bacterium]